jgi:hypothetical protein
MVIHYKHRVARGAQEKLGFAFLPKARFGAKHPIKGIHRSDPLPSYSLSTEKTGITEGFHRKMKLIQRRADGFRNFQNYRLRVIAQCG